MKNLFRILTLCVSLICFNLQLNAQNYYKVTPLGFSYLDGKAINNNGQVTGENRVNDNAFLWQNGEYIDIPNTGSGGASWGLGLDINNNGEVTGYTTAEGNDYYGFIYSEGVTTYIPLPPPNGHSSDGYGINDSGWVTGRGDYGTNVAPYLYKDGVMTNLGTFGGHGYGEKINNQGWVVGFSSTNIYSNDMFPFIYKGAGLVQLPLLPNGLTGKASDLNKNGEACGLNVIHPGFDDVLQAVKWNESGNVISLAALSGQSHSIAYAINDTGDVVGEAIVGANDHKAVVWRGNQIKLINSLINPSLNIILYTAVDINDNGEILCHGIMNNVSQYFVISPPSKKFVVNKTGDESDADLGDGKCDVDLQQTDDQCTCRAAIEQANYDVETDTIIFDIPGGGVPTIAPTLPLPIASSTIIIDGTTQPETGFVEISGINAGDTADGLNITASDCVIKGLVINQFNGYGISLNGVQNDTITSCIIGADPTGMTAKANISGGIKLNNSSNILIGGGSLSKRNVISGNGLSGYPGGHGILIKGNQSIGNRIEGNIIGANIDGTEALPNKAGVTISSSNNFIGNNTTVPGTPPGNLISGNKASGVTIDGGIVSLGASGNKVIGNLIGTNLNGTDSLANQFFGVFINNNSDDNIIGGSSIGDRNIISGNRYTGVLINSELTSGNQISGNYIGVDLSGQNVVGNGVQGVLIDYSPNNLIGGQSPEERNVVTGNRGAQVVIYGGTAVDNRVAGNYIGTYSDGTTLPENPPLAAGIGILFGSNNVIGGNNPNEGNLVSGNEFGIIIQQANNNQVIANLIGTDFSGTEKLGNGQRSGVGLFWGSNNTIGGINPGSRNLISGNVGGISLIMDQSEFLGQSSTSSSMNNLSELLPDTKKYYAELTQAFRKIPMFGQINTPFPHELDGTIIRQPSSGFEVGAQFKTEDNKIIGNYIGTTQSGMDTLGNSLTGIFIGPGCNNNIVGGRLNGEGNLISGNGHGIILYNNVTGCKMQGNAIGVAVDHNTPLPNSKGGIQLANVMNNVIGGVKSGAGNIISNNPNGVELLYTKQNKIIRNQITRSDTGIKIKNADRDEIISNRIWYNHTGINIENSKIILKANSVKNNTGSSTGIYMDNSFGEISGNEIEGNSGDGIRCTNQSQPVVHFNNINGNIGFGLENTTSSVTIEATGNWWGDPSGPGGVGPGTGDPVSSGVNYADWLTEPASVVIAAGADTIYYPIGYTDSVMISFQNWVTPNDILDVTITESYDWLTSPSQQSVQLNENTGGGTIIEFSIPGNVSSGEVNTVNIHAVSQSNYNYEATDSIIIYPYQSMLSSILVFPDSATVAMADSQQFSSIGYDQYGIPLNFEPIWSAAKGIIDSSGLYSAPDFITTDTVTVTDPVTQVSSFTVVFIQYPSDVNEGKNSVPKEYTLSQNFPNPFNPSTKIRFALPESGSVKLEVFNILGERVASLLNDEMTAGYHEVILNAGSLSSGIYFYRINASSFSQIKKMILLK